MFSAAADILNLPGDGSAHAGKFYTRANDEAVPQFFAAARAAGIRQAVMIGTSIPGRSPADRCVPYVTSRHNTDVAVRALSTGQFNVCSLNARLSSVSSKAWKSLTSALAAYAGAISPGCRCSPRAAAPITSAPTHWPSQLWSAPGERASRVKAYLVGDENYSWKGVPEAVVQNGNPLTWKSGR